MPEGPAEAAPPASSLTGPNPSLTEGFPHMAAGPGEEGVFVHPSILPPGSPRHPPLFEAEVSL